MTGMHRTTGRQLDGIAHIRQSIADILTTPLGSRIMRRDYGSLIPELIDHPDNGANRVRLYAACFTAIIKWEPRIKLSRMQISRTATPGTVNVLFDGTVNAQRIQTAVALQLGAV